MSRTAGVSAVLVVAVLILGFVAGFAAGAYGRGTVTVTETIRTLATTTVTRPGGTVTQTALMTTTVGVTRTVVSTSVATVTTTFTRVVGGVGEVCFSKTMNCASLIVSLIDSAKSRVLVAVYSFTSDPIAEALIRAHQRGVEVRVVIERQQADVRGSEYQRLKSAGIDVRLDGNSELMHHKFVVIDDETVITGSYNFTASAEDENDENVVVIYDREVARAFAREFERVWAQAS
ncbi:MAG: phospholipase D family protein [Aigarchaeota archaeon]|nr:phospholipase D family protein [Candidatus Calditenuis fumarioli]